MGMEDETSDRHRDLCYVDRPFGHMVLLGKKSTAVSTAMAPVTPSAAFGI